ncbi:MAG: error-prone DNA polymerase, partial [Alcaligenes faecalis]|nr:error-prone DNA polymerase [Alcaligenes faecalis]
MKSHIDLLYSELDCLSNYSFLNGASHPEELVSRAAELGYKALALCDYASMAGVVRAYAQAKLHPEIRLLVGSRFCFTGVWEPANPPNTHSTSMTGDATQAHELLILPRNKEGYGNLCQFISHVHQSLDLKQQASIDWSFLQQARQGSQQHVLPDCLAIYKPAYGLDSEHIHLHTQRLLELFAGRLFLGISLHRRDQDMQHLRAVRLAAQESGVPCAALGGVHMHVRSRQPLHDTLAAIRLKTPVQECGWSLAGNAEHHLRSRFQLANLYPAELRETTDHIQALCQFCLSEIKYEYPVEIVPPGLSGIEYLRQETERGVQRRYPKGISDHLRMRLEQELSLIADLGYEAYFLTLHDIVSYARSQGILCQGRGSAANSAVCYCLGITEVDPASSHTLFARFISRARAEPPDIDVDFEHQRREEVIQYIYRKYGRQRAALTAVITTYRRRSALRDTGKALSIPQPLVEALIQCDRAWLNDTRIQDEVFARFPQCPPEQAHQWLSLTRQLMGFPRHLSQHPGGFVISQTPLHRLVPIQNAAMPGRSVVQWDKDDLDVLGLLKVDILALGMLSALRRCLDSISQQKGKPFHLQDIPLQSAKTFRMIRRADTIGVFQIESRAQMSMLPRLRPTCFYDLVVQVAIVRPGPIQGGMVHPYLERRRDHRKVDYPAPEIRHVLARTLGVPIFQEQAMELAMEAAGFSADKADALRRAMAAWRRRGGLGPFEQELLDGMAAKGYDPEFSQR